VFGKVFGHSLGQGGDDDSFSVLGPLFDCFNEADDVIDRFEIPKNWLIYSGHDFGDAHTAALFYAQDPATGNLFAFAEYLPEPSKGIYDHVQDFKQITAGYNVLQRVGGNHAEGQIRQGYTSQGWPISEPKHSQDVKLQRKLVQGMHRLNKVFIFNDLVNCYRELLSMAFKKDGSTLTDLIDNEPRFHLLACARYILSNFTPETVETGQSRQSIFGTPVSQPGRARQRIMS